ncbi:hypothetical protein GGI20_001557 [Coemansia sp. BCRC 34301]|nr:hypothetical protein GGI20_001557 [Coemansia sp. BCRC 34301]
MVLPFVADPFDRSAASSSQTSPFEAPKHSVTIPKFEPYAVPDAALWEQFTDAVALRWKRSQATKKDEEEARYNGEWAVEEIVELAGVQGDKGLVAKSQARHHAISAHLEKPFDPSADGLVLQYEVKLQENLGCGGAYIKLLTAPLKGEFSDATPYTLMFGPDKCGDSKVHLIYRHLNPITGEYTEHHLSQPPAPPIDTLSHLYTLTIHTNNTYAIAIDGSERRTGSLLDDFAPPVNPPKEIDDPKDKKPASWEDNEKIPDPAAKKPADWDEDAPLMIPDEDAVKPKDWLEDEPLLIPDPKAQKPADWDDEEDGDWAAPMISNPRCADTAGCGPWERPLMRNLDFKGKWSAPLIANPRYKGEWAPRRISNPGFFEDHDLYKLSQIDAVGFELWTMQSGITFDNIYLGSSPDAAALIADNVWKPKHDVELAVSEALRPKPPPAPKPGFADVLRMFKDRLDEILYGISSFYSLFQSEGIVAALRQERAGAFGLLMVTMAIGWLGWNASIVLGFAYRLVVAAPAASAPPAVDSGDSLPDSAEDAWSPFWLLPDGPHDVFSLVTPADIRRIRDSARENFIKLVDKVFDRLLVLKAAKDLTRNQASTKQLLNCVRILTRLVPFAYEACPDGSTVEDILLWTPRPRPGSGADYTLGRQLVSAAIDLLFTSGFTVPPATVGEDAVVRYAIWDNGIGQASSLGSSKDHVSNRVEVLRLVLVLASKTMYVPPAMAAAAPNRALHAMAYNSNKRMVLSLLCSLLNTSLKDRVQGWAIPYRTTTAMDPNDALSLQAMQALFVLLEYQVPTSAGNSTTTEPHSAADSEADDTTPSIVLVTGAETGPQNLFRVFTAKLHRTQEFDYLVSSIIRLLEEAMRANLSILASVTKQPTRNAMPREATILLWMLLEANAPFKDYLVDHNSSLKLFSVLMYFMLNGYNDPAQAGMVRTTSHILHYLSEDSRFATRLMQPFDQSILPSTMRVVDASLTHADFMINTVYTLLSSSRHHLVPVYSSLLLLMRNVSPYLTQVSQITADKLVALFDIISSPAFLISEPYHVRWLIYLLEVFDYVVHYRAADNPHLMYSMVQARSCFTRLRGFDLDKARAELLALRKKKGKSESARTIGSASVFARNSVSDVYAPGSRLRLDMREQIRA